MIAVSVHSRLAFSCNKKDCRNHLNETGFKTSKSGETLKAHSYLDLKSLNLSFSSFQKSATMLGHLHGQTF